MLEIKNLSKAFNFGTPDEFQIFDNFNLTIEDGSCIAILGSNGSGKSTLFNLIYGSLNVDNGKILLNERDITNLSEAERSNMITKVNQDPNMGVCPNLTVLENMSLAIKKGEDFSLKKLIKLENKAFIIEKLKRLNIGLENKLFTKVKNLSGGQRQSLSLLMATIKNPELLLLDEHTAALDPRTSKSVMDMTENLIKREKITTMMITHNLQNSIDYSDRIIMLEKGEIILDVKSEDINIQELTSLYNRKVA